MSRLVSKIWKPALTVLLGVAAFLFWWLRYPHALAFQEQWQLFLFEGDYLASRLSEPGGVARYVAEFLVQFFNNVMSGALILALLYMLIQRMTWRLMKPAADCWYPLSFVPVMMTWMLQGDEQVMPTFLVALALMLAAMLAWPKRTFPRMAYVVIGIPLLYWMIGPLVLFVAIYMAFSGQKSAKNLVWGAVAVVYVIACVWISSLILPYPLFRLTMGLSFYRDVVSLPYLMLAIPTVNLLLAVLGTLLHEYRRPKAILAGTFVLLVALVVILPSCYDQRKYDLIEYDYLVRLNRWDDIIAKSTQRQPDLPMSVCATNLALGMKGELGEKAFDFYQNGVGGLLPAFERNFNTLPLTGEAYFQLGLVNTAQRFSFEAMEALPNYNKSARSVKRLAETNLINGQYDVAEKYLRMLEKTIFYRNWAKRTETLLRNEQLINEHPLYGKMRRMRLDEDFLFSESEIDKICGRLYIHDNGNQLAMQYLLMCPLLEGNINKFMDYLPIVQEKMNYNPRVCQEALAYVFMRNNKTPPAHLVSPMVQQQLAKFMQAYRDCGGKKSAMGGYQHTLWYYLIGDN